jgi:hypothetical protein
MTRYLLLIPLIASHFAVAQLIIEEVVAVVGATPILRSDVSLAELVRLLESDPGESRSSYRSRLLGARVRLELQYRDLADSGTLYRLSIDVETARATMVERAGGEEHLRIRMEEFGLAWVDLDELGLRIAAAAAYTEQRLRPRVRVSLEELQTAYQELVVSELEQDGQPVPPLTEVRDQLHQLLVERKLNTEIERWLESAAERHEVTRFVP